MWRHDLHPTAIIWDLDGTLIESAPDLATALNTLLNEQGHLGHPLEQVRPMIGGGVATLIERGFRAAGAPLNNSARNALVPRFMEIYTGCCTQTTALRPGARDALLCFYNAGILQGLCTNKPRVVTERILITLDIIGFFESIVGGDSTTELKPHPRPLLTCLRELGVTAEQAIMIGDSDVDVCTARAANVPVILVSDGSAGTGADIPEADRVVASLAEIPGAVLPHGPLRHRA